MQQARRTCKATQVSRVRVNGSRSTGEVWRRQPDNTIRRLSACESASIARRMPREYKAIRDREARRESKDSKRAAECLRQGRAQQVARTMSMEHHLRRMSKGNVRVQFNLRAKHRKRKITEIDGKMHAWSSSDASQTMVRQSRLAIGSPTPLRRVSLR